MYFVVPYIKLKIWFMTFESSWKTASLTHSLSTFVLLCAVCTVIVIAIWWILVYHRKWCLIISKQTQHNTHLTILTCIRFWRIRTLFAWKRIRIWAFNIQHAWHTCIRSFKWEQMSSDENITLMEFGWFIVEFLVFGNWNKSIITNLNHSKFDEIFPYSYFRSFWWFLAHILRITI